MAFLNSAVAVADYLHNPRGLWEILILGLFKFIVNYGWRIVFFTVCLKILLMPLDLFQRFKMRKNQIITERLKPQLEKLQQQYAGDKQMLARKQMELNKKEGFSYFSSCLPMIVTLVIFFYLFAGLRNISQYMNLKQYLELYDAYNQTVEDNLDEKFDITTYGNVSWNEINGQYQVVLATAPNENDYKTDGEWDSAKNGGEAGYKAAYDEWNEGNDGRNSRDLLRARDELENSHIKPIAQEAVEVKYSEIKESFLWVSNIWSPDVPWSRSILSHSSFTSNISNYKTFSKVKSKLRIAEDEYFNSVTYADMISESTYNNVMGSLLEKSSPYNRVNGYLILPILSVALSFLSQFITTRLQKKSGQVTEGSMGSMKWMMIIMPLMMGVFALSYTAMFTLYIVVNSAITILINVITTLAMNKHNKDKDKKLTTTVQKYGRPDPKDL